MIVLEFILFSYSISVIMNVLIGRDDLEIFIPILPHIFKPSKGCTTLSLFSKILGKLGIGKDKPATAGTTAAPVTPATAPKPVAPPTTYKPTPRPVPGISKEARDDAVERITSEKPVAPAPAPISEVDVVKKLEVLGKGTGLDWKVSIVDLLKLLEIDSSRESRNELAKELGCPEEFMKDSAKMNTWLHKEVLRKIAANGGNIPKEMLD